MPPVLASLLGIVAILAFAFLLSNAKRKIRLRVVVSAFALQALLAFLILRTSGGRMVIREMSAGVAALLSYADAGTAFLFGADNPLQNTFALGALPVIVFFAALVSILYHLGIMQVIVRPYLAALAPSRLFTLMTVGMAGVAGTILAAYAGLLGNEYLPFLLAAAFMSAPGGILMAKIIMPDVDDASPEAEGELSLPRGRISAEGPAAITERRETHEVEATDTFEEGERPANVIEAAAQGAQTGVKLAVAVGAMLLAFVALVALANGVLGWVGMWFGYPELSFQQLLGYIFAPIMFLIGVPWEDAGVAGGLFGTKIVLNEFVSFIDGDRRAGAQPAPRDRQAWRARPACRVARQFDERGTGRALPARLKGFPCRLSHPSRSTVRSKTSPAIWARASPSMALPSCAIMACRRN